jgi:hypothetical protein
MASLSCQPVAGLPTISAHFNITLSKPGQKANIFFPTNISTVGRVEQVNVSLSFDCAYGSDLSQSTVPLQSSY